MEIYIFARGYQNDALSSISDWSTNQHHFDPLKISSKDTIKIKFFCYTNNYFLILPIQCDGAFHIYLKKLKILQFFFNLDFYLEIKRDE